MDTTALFKLTYGLYVVSSAMDGKSAGCLINTAVQVTAEPPRLSVAVARSNYTHDLIAASRRFALSVLTKDAPMELIQNFGFRSSKNCDKFSASPCGFDESGVRYLKEYCAARFSCSVESAVEVGTHTVFIGLLEEAEVLDDTREPITYDYYHRVKKGKTPKSAPSYQETAAGKAPVSAKKNNIENKKEKAAMKKYVCQVCGYVYDEEEQGVKWEDLPDDYACPICGAGKELFEEQE